MFTLTLNHRLSTHGLTENNLCKGTFPTSPASQLSCETELQNTQIKALPIPACPSSLLPPLLYRPFVLRKSNDLLNGISELLLTLSLLLDALLSGLCLRVPIYSSRPIPSVAPTGRTFLRCLSLPPPARIRPLLL